MDWPKEILDALDDAVTQVTLAEGYTKVSALRHFLDMAASMAVWRAKGEPEALEGCYFWPYTPIGHLTNTGFGGTMTRFSLGGQSWGDALDSLRRFVRANKEAICREYGPKPIEYPHGM